MSPPSTAEVPTAGTLYHTRRQNSTGIALSAPSGQFGGPSGCDPAGHRGADGRQDHAATATRAGTVATGGGSGTACGVAGHRPGHPAPPAGAGTRSPRGSPPTAEGGRLRRMHAHRRAPGISTLFFILCIMHKMYHTHIKYNMYLTKAMRLSTIHT